jgi:rRNA maturation RNase YbeY
MAAPKQVHFFKEDIRFRLHHSAVLPSWILKVIKKRNKYPGEINYIFCSDRYLLKLNRQYLHHSTYTDIITFNTAEEKDLISGDIFISAERVRQNAGIFKTTFSDELHRVMIHGILHLAGYRDKTAAEKKKMRAMEDGCLALRNF